MSARSILTLLVLVLSLAAAGCASSTGSPSVGGADPAVSESPLDPDSPAVDPAAGTCLEGTVDCVDTPGLGMCAPDVDPADCQDVVIEPDPSVTFLPQEPAEVGEAAVVAVPIAEAVTISDTPSRSAGGPASSRATPSPASRWSRTRTP